MLAIGLLKESEGVKVFQWTFKKIREKMQDVVHLRLQNL